MKIVADRLRLLRNKLGLSQAKLGKVLSLKQATLNRYENDQASPPFETMLRYADYFDVSLDYIFGRTDEPRGKIYEYRPKLEKSYPEMEKFVEMCFDPDSPMNERLKETLIKMLKEAKT